MLTRTCNSDARVSHFLEWFCRRAPKRRISGNLPTYEARFPSVKLVVQFSRSAAKRALLAAAAALAVCSQDLPLHARTLELGIAKLPHWGAPACAILGNGVCNSGNNSRALLCASKLQTLEETLRIDHQKLCAFRPLLALEKVDKNRRPKLSI